MKKLEAMIEPNLKYRVGDILVSKKKQDKPETNLP
jgi:hypothetical protein